VAGGKVEGVVGEGAGVMYEVRWTLINGEDKYDPFETQGPAWSLYDTLQECDDIDSVGLYYTDGDGNEKELASWSR